MNETPPPDLPGGLAGALETLRHALADPLSTAGLKLEVVERRLSATPSDASLADRVRGAVGDLAAAGRLLDLLPRLAGIAAEAPALSSIADLCREAGIEVEEGEVEKVAASRLPLLLRRRACVDALRSVASLLSSEDPGGERPLGRAQGFPGGVSLRVAADRPGSRRGTDLERLLRLPRGEERGEELFLALAGIESDGGRLQLVEEEGRLVALFSWPVPAPAGDAGGPA